MRDGSADHGPRHGRLAWPRPDELDPAAREVYDAIAGGPRASSPRVFRMTDEAGRLEGPFNAMLVAPSVGLPLQELGAAIRYRTSLSGRVREIAILAVAAHHRCDFEWYAHEAIGLATGLSAGEIADLKDGRTSATLDAHEAAAHRACLSLLRTRRLDDPAYADAVTALDPHELAELATLVGYYEALQLLLGTWDTPLPDGVASPFEGEVG